MTTTCRSCGAEIEWAVTVNGKRIPLDLGEYEGANLEVRDGTAYSLLPPPERARRSHFATCSHSIVEHCPQGHPYAGENLYVDPRGNRQCRICRADAQRRLRARRR